MSPRATTSAIHRGQDLSTINEDSLSRGRSESPVTYTSGIEAHDFTDRAAGPKRRSTHPQISFGPESETPFVDGDPRFNRRATMKAHPTGGKSGFKRIGRQLCFKRTGSSESFVANKKPRRHSTINTDASIITNASASFDETKVWDQKALLALDGGGIRGYSALLILEALMKEIGKLERTRSPPAMSSFHPLSPAPPSIATDSESMRSQNLVEPPQTETSPWLPCHYFDYMAGTSTGGLISIMLGRLRMNIDDCIRDYEYFGEKVFGNSRWFHIRSPLFWVRDKYDHKILEAAVQQVVDRNVPYVASFPGGRNFAFDENRCRTVVLSYQRQKHEAQESPYIFRTYKNLHRSENREQRLLDRNPGLAHDIPIWQVARATSAAPTYFEPPKTGDLEYLDGGMGANNPCEELYDEVRRMNNDSYNCVRVIFSVGTGKNKKAARFRGKGSQGVRRYLNIINWAKKWASDSQQAHLRMMKTQQRDKFSYFRLNVEEGLDEMKLDEWRVRGALRTTVGKSIKSLRSWKKSSPNPSNCNNAQSHEGSAAEKNDRLLATPEEAAVPAWFQPKNSTLDSIRTKTESYLAQDDVQKWLEETAKILVTIRRNRTERDPQRWEKACFGAWYQCKIEGCPRAEKVYERREALRTHLKDKHKTHFKVAAEWDEVKLDATLDLYKIVVR